MCKSGENEDVELVNVWISPENSCTADWKPKMVTVDKCIAPIIRALVNAGVYTTSCCCGHGEHEGVIKLADGRCIIILDKESHDIYWWNFVDFRTESFQSISSMLKQFEGGK